jgi:hypothetical protein
VSGERTPVEMIQQMLDDAMRMRHEPVVMAQTGEVQTSDGLLPFTICVACGPGAIMLRSLVAKVAEPDPRSPWTPKEGKS